jgi:hypothetical protein
MNLGRSVILSWAAVASACSTLPSYETLEGTDSALIPAAEARIELGERGDALMPYLAVLGWSSQGQDSGSLDSGTRFLVGGVQLDGPLTYDVDFDLRFVEFVFGARLQLDDLKFDSHVGYGSFEGKVDLATDVLPATEKLDLGGFALGIALEVPVAEWLGWRTAMDVALGSEATASRIDSVLRLRIFRFVHVDVGIGRLAYERVDAGGSDIELEIVGPRIGLALSL